MRPYGWIRSSFLLITVAGAGLGLAIWKYNTLQAAQSAAQNQPEPIESVTVAVAQPRQHRRITTSIGTVLALRSITIRNELPGTVRHVAMTPGQVVEAGTVLVRLDTSVEDAELSAYQAQATLAQTLLERAQKLRRSDAATFLELEQRTAERDVAQANVERMRAIIERKTIRAPFRARVGISDTHVGQYLEEGTPLTTLQGVDDAVHVDFAVAQWVARELKPGDRVDVLLGEYARAIAAEIVAVDARIDPATRNAMVRARMEDVASVLRPGASVRVRTPVGRPLPAVAVPVSAVRKGPAGDQVFVIQSDPNGGLRAHTRLVRSGAMLGDEVMIHEGLEAGDQVAASGSFKLFDGVRVMIAADVSQDATAAR